MMRRDGCMMNIDATLEQFNLLHKKDTLLKIAASSIGITKEIADEVDIQIGSSKFGGMPDLPTNLSFPKYENGYLSFLAQIDLSEAKSYDKENLLPKLESCISFMTSSINRGGWIQKNKESFQVYYLDGELGELSRTPYPEINEDYFPLPTYKITFTDISTFPEDLNGLELTEEDWIITLNSGKFVSRGIICLANPLTFRTMCLKKLFIMKMKLKQMKILN